MRLKANPFRERYATYEAGRHPSGRSLILQYEAVDLSEGRLGKVCSESHAGGARVTPLGEWKERSADRPVLANRRDGFKAVRGRAAASTLSQEGSAVAHDVHPTPGDLAGESGAESRIRLPS